MNCSTPAGRSQYVRIGRAAEYEADQLRMSPGAPVFRITRVAANEKRAGGVNFVMLNGERFELCYAVD